MLLSRQSLKWAVTAIAAMMLASAPVQGGTVLYVDDDAPLGGDGQSWDTAYKFLQDALANAGGMSEIRVGQGSYKPDQDEAGNVTPLDREATFQLISGVSLVGGFDVESEVEGPIVEGQSLRGRHVEPIRMPDDAAAPLDRVP